MNELFKKIPKVDDLLAHPALRGEGGLLLLTEAVRGVLAALREDVLAGTFSAEAPSGSRKCFPSADALAEAVLARVAEARQPGLRRVVNGTGVVLHTNLGRAPLAKEALVAVTEAARGYSNLEYDIEGAARGSRFAHVEGLLVRLTGAEAAFVVNNNAAAVLLALAALAGGREVLTSRGELVEIGGSFRIPEVCAQSGCRLVEVGTTNKTHLKDYATVFESEAVSEGAAKIGAILRVHASNFRMTGFVSRPPLAELAALARGTGVPLIEDLGSGALAGVCGRPTVAESVRGGADVVTFSGDKLLGGPQAGIVVGRAACIGKMKAHPLARALRIDKLSLAALEATLRLYLEPETAAEKIPTLRMLSATEGALKAKAARLAAMMGEQAGITAIPVTGQAGGGAMPEEELPSWAVAFTHGRFSAREIERHFRLGAIIGRIWREAFLLDVRTVDEADFAAVAARWAALENPPPGNGAAQPGAGGFPCAP